MNCMLKSYPSLKYCNRSDNCRLKEETWTPVAKKLGISWQAAEALLWKMSKAGIARRAGGVPSKRRGRNRTSCPLPSGSPKSSGGQVASPRSNVRLPPFLHHHPSQLHGQAQLPSFKEVLKRCTQGQGESSQNRTCACSIHGRLTGTA